MKIFLHGIIAGMLAAIAGIIYFNIYQNTLGTAFNAIVNMGTISGSCIFACVPDVGSVHVAGKI